MVLDVLNNPTPEGQQQMLALAKEKMGQQTSLMGRLTTAQQAFLRAAAPAQDANQPAPVKSEDAGKDVVPAPTAPAPTAPEKTAAQKPSTPAGWTAFQLPGEKVTVSVPVKPQSIKQPGPGGKTIETFLSVDQAKGQAYTASVVPLGGPDQSAASAKPDAVLKGFADGFAKTSGAVAMTRTSGSVGGFKSGDFVFNDVKSGKYVHARVVLLPDRMAILTATSQRAALAGDAQAYIESLSLGK
jgi:hypothetical protein